MFVDYSGALGNEHARDMRSYASAHRTARAVHRPSHALRALATRMQLGPAYNYRSR